MLAASDGERRDTVRRPYHKPFLLYGVLCFCFGILMYLSGVLLVFPRYLLGLHRLLDPAAEALVWYSGIPIMAGMVLALFDIIYMLRHKKPNVPVRFEPVRRRRVTVALTAYNDEESIAGAIEDFLFHPLVERVVVVSNNSSDRTFERAQAAGAITFNEVQPGYGRCVFRCLSEAVKFDDTEFVVLCEGDSTFRAYDIEKLLAYAPHADIVNGTRTVEPLRQYMTQLSTFMFYGNLFVGKLLEAKHLGKGTFTDVGTTYKLCRTKALKHLLPRLNSAVNLEFNAHFLDTALTSDLVLLECPITFHPRIGLSKGGNVNNWRGFTVGSRMIFGLLTGWERYA